jgi:hypothetical protein
MHYIKYIAYRSPSPIISNFATDVVNLQQQSHVNLIYPDLGGGGSCHDCAKREIRRHRKTAWTHLQVNEKYTDSRQQQQR